MLRPQLVISFEKIIHWSKYEQNYCSVLLMVCSSETVLAHDPWIAVVLANIAVANHAHLTDFPLMRPGALYTATLCWCLLNSPHTSWGINVAQKFQSHPYIFLYTPEVRSRCWLLLWTSCSQNDIRIFRCSSCLFARVSCSHLIHHIDYSLIRAVMHNDVGACIPPLRL